MNKKIKLYPSQGLVFFKKGDNFLCCDPLRKNEYALEPDYLSRLLFWDGNKEDYLTSIDEELIEGDLLFEQPQVTEWKGDSLTYAFHLATRNHSSMTPKLSEDEVVEAFTGLSAQCGEAKSRRRPARIVKSIPLKEANISSLNKMALFEVFLKRKTSRNFQGKSISLDDLATILYANFGPIHGEVWDELQDLGVNFSSERRANPSGSGLQACDCYLSIAHVEGVQAGFYWYDSENHSLELLSEHCDDEMQSYLMCDQFWIKGSAVGLFITVDMDRIWHKSTLPRSYAYAFLEAGHISQNLLLSATALGLQTWLSGTMRDEYVAQRFGVDGDRCFPVSTVFIGMGTDEAVPTKIQSLVLQKES